MSPKGKQARLSQRKKAQQKALALIQEVKEAEQAELKTPANAHKKGNKRSRETEQVDDRSSEEDNETEQFDENNASADIETEGSESSNNNPPNMDTSDQNDPSQESGTEGDKGKENSTDEEVNKASLKTPPAMGPAHWEQIMARFDSFEKAVQTTIKDEIKIISAGMQKQVKSLNTKVREVENSISANKNEIKKINQKVAHLGNLEEAIASEVQKCFSVRVASLEKDLQESKAEITKLKRAKPNPPAKGTDNSDQVTRNEFLREQRFNRRRNLMLVGVEEVQEGEDEKVKISELLQTRLNIPKPKLEMVTRMGAAGGNNPRPALITFAHIDQRYNVWYKKSQINKDQTQKIWVQEDLPKKLRTELSALLKIQKRAKAMQDKYPDTKIKDFKIRIQGRYYEAQELELLPDDLKPSRTTTPQSDDAVVFFGRSSPLSNHHLCNIKIAGRAFTCVEHFLAWQRANTAKVKELADEVLQMKDPSEHKNVLNSLKEKNTDDWEDTVGNVLLTALRAKFQQNEALKKFLCDTYPRKIGEASLNPQWGIGLSLTDANVLDTTKWNEDGNRLGKTLEKIREELLHN